MKSIAFKSGVVIKEYTPALNWILRCLLDIQNAYDWLPQLMVTSINDGEHSKIPLSRHYKNEAVDIRTHYFTSEADTRIFLGYLNHYLNQSPEAEKKNAFTILLEYEGTMNEHIHIQPKIGETYP